MLKHISNFLQNNTVFVVIPELDISIFRELNIHQYRAVIAGGAALRWYRGESVDGHDIDVWFSDQTSFNAMNERFMNNSKYVHAYESVNAITWKYKIPGATYKIQLIKKFNSDVYSLLNSFDISVAQIATDGKRWYFGEHTLSDLQNKKLRVLQHHPTILRRLFKYWTYGYTPDDETLNSLISNNQIVWDYQDQDSEDY